MDQQISHRDNGWRIIQLAGWMSMTLLLVMVLLWSLPAPSTQAAQGIIFVDQNAPGELHDGLSWTTAYTDLQTALNQAVSGTQIWVAIGIYKPGNTISSTFQLTSGVALYGGFAGNELALTQRDWAHNRAILSGDVDSNDRTENGVVTDTAGITGSNVLHVLSSYSVTPAAATVDGFIITAGYARGSHPDNNGGGLWSDNSNLVLSNLTFSGNYADWGGGISGGNSYFLLTDVAFNNNYATSCGGGTSSNGHHRFNNVTFSGNHANAHGGGMYNDLDHPTLINVVFKGNSAAAGGGIFNARASSPILNNVLFSGNRAVSWGGGLYNDNSRPLLMNVTFSGNQAGQGGGMYNTTSSRPIVANSIFWGNRASSNGNQIYNYDGGSLSTISYSIIEGGCPSGTSCSNLISGNPDPQFIAPLAAGFAPTAGGDYRLRSISPAIDAGNNLSVTVTTELDGHLRRVDLPGAPNTGVGPAPIVDLGPYEMNVLYVDRDAPGSGTGLSWTTAYTNLQSALNAATYGSEIWVAEGIYTPTYRTVLTDSRSATFFLIPGVEIYGGFSGYGIGETRRTQRDWTTHPTILSGDIDNNDWNTDTNRIAETWNDLVGANAYHVVSSNGLTESARLDGFIITAGKADLNSGQFGSGMSNEQSHPTLSNLIFSGNQSPNGGGLGNHNSAPQLNNVVFTGNRGLYVGGGMYNDQSSPSLHNVIFKGNHVDSMIGGGGMANIISSSPTLVNVYFYGNSGSFGGALTNADDCNPLLINVALIGNQADFGGAIFNMRDSHPQLINITCSGNKTNYGVGSGGCLYNETNSNPVIVNSILWGNHSDQISNQNSNPVVLYSDVQGGYTGTANLNVDPQFTAPITAILAPTTTVQGDYRLNGCSPLIDAGNILSVTEAIDLIGYPRQLRNGADLGAYETAVGVCKTVTPAVHVPYHGTVTYTITLANYQKASEPATWLTDSLPAGVTFGEWLQQPAGTSVNNGTIARQGVLTPNTVLTIAFTAQQTGDFGSWVTNTAAYSGSIWSYSAASFQVVENHTLTITQSGNGSGTITPAVGTHLYPYGTVIPLQAVAADGSAFTGWSGSADCEDGTVTLYTDTLCTAVFALNSYTLTVATAGNGSGIVAPTAGPHSYLYGTVVALSAMPQAGSTFQGWSGAPDCTDGSITMDADKICTATFTLNTYTLTVATTGTGAGLVTPIAGLHPYLYGTEITLTAVPTAGSLFTGWAGGCTGTGTCRLTIHADQTVTAAFNLAPIAHAGPLQTVKSGTLVILDGTGSTGQTPLAYGWTQTGGPTVTLSNRTVVTPTFTALAVHPTVLTFTLVVTDAVGTSEPASVVITVEPHRLFLPVVLRRS